MDAWTSLVEMAGEGRIEITALEDVRRLISSACVARVDQPRTMVSTAVLDHLILGWSWSATIVAVEELIALRHNRMLIASGRRAGDDQAAFAPLRRANRTVLPFRSRNSAA